MAGLYINQHVLNNLFYILVTVFAFSFIYDHSPAIQRKPLYNRTLLCACLALASVLCMRFPIYIDPTCIHDFRQIPFLLGTLYGGGIVGAVFFAVLMLARTILYGFQSLTFVVYAIMFVVAAAASPLFRRLPRSGKLFASLWLTFLIAILTTFVAVIIADFSVTKPYIVYFIIMPPFVMMFAVYLMETLHEAQLARAELMKMEKMEIVSQLAASISHEIRNPLTVVKGFIQLLQTEPLPRETKERYIRIALEEVERAEGIIHDYLTFAKPAPKETEPIDVAVELRKVLQMIAPMAHMHSVDLSSSLEHGIVIGNVQYFQQCFLNLLKNSIEAMPNGGTLRVTVENQETSVVITISDNGIGMTKEQVRRFGEPYFSTKEKGTGLGAMVAVKIIEQMGGTWKVESTVQKGTTLTITLPARQLRLLSSQQSANS
ncbi:two-component sensor histidine kinase [Geobacillus sp. 47C-IIb]|uniref:histidine kinase n=1 Tax=Geobacillus thermodenitrificans TaxID=33940 RepID=A0ABY9QFY4_GEOTD|nr:MULTISPECIES: ATP-binding protein [Geobacillus]ATO36093.1 two-component sensor histidine kinase [Geobacillus thermodenitrificans]OQP11045.1 two-component sensor histidine kinase [Geobacillus sp. 47C-IIb]QNU31216.1 ATP-binding protein [Geobacillus sp. 47C-IIb]WMV77794.1 ATP-binding protein [Geobacillus thermodenitrificans]